jgi:phenylacetate-CoA ligase
MVLRPSSMLSAAAVVDTDQHVRAWSPRLARAELLAPDELAAYRAPFVSKLLAHARQNVDFYRGRFGFDINSPDEIATHWSQIPILTRADAVKHRLSLLSARTPAEAGPITEKETSGSTGMPLRYRATAAFDDVNCALTERMFRRWRVDGNKALAQIAQSRPGPSRQGETSCGWHTARPKGIKYSLAHFFDVDTQLDWLLARKPAYLASFPGIIKELATTTLRRGVRLKFDLVFSVGAVLDAETREVCRSAFGAKISDSYGAQEGGHIAVECPDCGEYHLSADTSVVEILRDDGSPATDGEVGRVVVTPLHNYAMPLIRYELGDFAEVGAAGPLCARKLPRLRRILGRSRNLFRFRDGTSRWPIATGFNLSDYIRLTQFQVVQTDFDTIEIRYVPDGSPGPVDLAGLTERVRWILAQPVNVTVHPVERIQRAANGKYEDCISLVGTAASGP